MNGLGIKCDVDMDARTRAVTASTVTFAPGFRTDIDRLGQACRERDVFFLRQSPAAGKQV